MAGLTARKPGTPPRSRLRRARPARRRPMPSALKRIDPPTTTAAPIPASRFENTAGRSRRQTGFHVSITAAPPSLCTAGLREVVVARTSDDRCASIAPETMSMSYGNPSGRSPTSARNSSPYRSRHARGYRRRKRSAVMVPLVAKGQKLASAQTLGTSREQVRVHVSGGRHLPERVPVPSHSRTPPDGIAPIGIEVSRG
jgi:hypothetical protein